MRGPRFSCSLACRPVLTPRVSTTQSAANHPYPYRARKHQYGTRYPVSPSLLRRFADLVNIQTGGHNDIKSSIVVYIKSYRRPIGLFIISADDPCRIRQADVGSKPWRLLPT